MATKAHIAIAAEAERQANLDFRADVLAKLDRLTEEIASLKEAVSSLASTKRKANVADQ